jgi:hypothetical protein
MWSMPRRSVIVIFLQAVGIRLSAQAAGAPAQTVNFEGKWRVKEYRQGTMQGPRILPEAGTVVFTKTGFDHQSKSEKPGPDDMTHSGGYEVSGNRLKLNAVSCWHNDPLWEAVFSHSGPGYTSYEFAQEGKRIVLKDKCVLEPIS